MTPSKAYQNDAINKIYDQIFCDDLKLYRDSHSDPEQYPWTTLFDENNSEKELRKIIDDWDFETRPKILAANILLERGAATDQRRIFGVVVEVGMDEGLDVLAAYEDGTARYINYSEKLIVWENKTEESNALVVDLFLAARKVVDQIGPWEGERLPPPISGNVRLTFLVSNGLYFGEGPFEILERDKMGGPVISCAAKVMGFLINMTERANA